MSLSLVLRGVETGALKNYIDVKLAPRKVMSISFLVDFDLMTVNNDGMIGVGNLICKSITSLRRIILQKICKHVGGGKIVDCNDIKSLCLEHLSECKTTNTTKTIDSYSNCHTKFLLISY